MFVQPSSSLIGTACFLDQSILQKGDYIKFDDCGYQPTIWCCKRCIARVSLETCVTGFFNSLHTICKARAFNYCIFKLIYLIKNMIAIWSIAFYKYKLKKINTRTTAVKIVDSANYYWFSCCHVKTLRLPFIPNLFLGFLPPDIDSKVCLRVNVKNSLKPWIS